MPLQQGHANRGSSMASSRARATRKPGRRPKPDGHNKAARPAATRPMKGDPRESPCLERRVASQRMLQHTLAKDRADSADIDASGLSDDRCLDLAPNSGLSLPVRLRSNRRNRVGLVGEGLPRLLLRRGETVRQATEMSLSSKSSGAECPVTLFRAWSSSACAAAINRK
jgi:hypothetical protein